MSEDMIKSINKTIVHEDGKIDSFDKQLINLSGGIFDVRFPLVVSDNTGCLNYISTINESKPLTMMVSTAIKIREKHDIGFAYVSQVNDLLKNSIMAFESLKHDTSVIVLLDDYDDIDDPMVAVLRTDKKVGYVDVNEITSIYDRERFSSLLQRTYDSNCTFFINDKEKTEQIINSFQFQVLDDLKFALSTSYDKYSFNKCQVEQDLFLNVEFSDYLGYWKMIDQTESNGSIYYCFESKEDSSYPFLVVDEDLNVLCESFEELEEAVENYLSENELDMSV